MPYNAEKNELLAIDDGAAMEYRRFGGAYYVRLDRGDEIVSTVLGICENEGIASATYSGIGGCGEAQIQTYIPETGEFEMRTLRGMLELVSLTGNVISDDGRHHHTHGAFAYKDGDEHRVAAGHVKSATVSYTAEIELRPVVGGTIGRKLDPETGTGFWSFPA